MSAKLGELCHLWRCAAFGADGDTLQRSLSRGYEGTVAGLLSAPPEGTSTPPPFTTLLPPGIMLTLLQVGSLIKWWVNEMVVTPYPLREKMVLFWHGHFTTSADPVFSGGLLLRQNQTLRAQALGRFEDILTAAAQDPAMLVYLDGKENRRAHPNENFARELLELFTLGIGHYTEADVHEAARALTGWRLAPPDGHAVYDADQHDGGVKQFLGQTGSFDMHDILRILCDHPQTARRISARLFRFFTGTDAGPAEVERLAATFTRTHGNIGAVVRALLLGDAFRKAAPGYKSPVEWLVNALRVLDARMDSLTWLEPLRLMGQLPFVPPSVKGWDDGAAWINTATLLDRINSATRLVQHLTARNSNGAALVGVVDQAQASTAVRNLLWTLGLADAGETTVHRMERLWTASQADGPVPTARRLVALALASPEFQMK